MKQRDNHTKKYLLVNEPPFKAMADAEFSDDMTEMSMPKPKSFHATANQHLPKKSVWEQLMERNDSAFANYLENEVITNVDVNMLFREGKGLTAGLIDANRLRQVIDRIKNIAASQYHSKAIDFAEVCKFVEDHQEKMLQEDKIEQSK